ncbi:MAG: tetratricopeptide repeat protein, partial [Planctomycetes bacterium]|nr:tetratricopeptide repeat protein [Planctomycetota bacterium]
IGDIALRRKNFDEAVDALKRLQRLCPMDPFSWRGLAGIHLKRGEDDLALSQLLELARTEEHDADVPARIGSIFSKKGRLGEARYWYQQSLYIAPFREDLHQSLGGIQMRMGDSAGALREYKMLTRLAPDNAKHFASAAIAANKLGDKQQAADLAREAIKLDPNAPVRSLIPKP